MNYDVPLLAGIASGVAVGWITSSLSKAAKSSRLRTGELEQAALALRCHAESVANIVDDPALPVSALELLVDFTEGIADRRIADEIAESVHARMEGKPLGGKVPAWYNDLEALRSHRPDLVETFDRALAFGFIAALLRWKHTAPVFHQFAQQMAAGNKNEAIAAERVSSRKRSLDDHNAGGGIPLPA